MQGSSNLNAIATRLKMTVETMFSFEVSAIDIVLLIAAMILLLLIITQRKGQAAAESPLSIRDTKKPLKKPETTDETAINKFSEEQPQVGFQKCVHHFGYLRNFPKNTPVPDECFGCPKVLRCLFPSKRI